MALNRSQVTASIHSNLRCNALADSINAVNWLDSVFSQDFNLFVNHFETIKFVSTIMDTIASFINSVIVSVQGKLQIFSDFPISLSMFSI